jgi:hypothetical protein
LPLALMPVPLLISAVLWMDRLEPEPRARRATRPVGGGRLGPHARRAQITLRLPGPRPQAHPPALGALPAQPGTPRPVPRPRRLRRHHRAATRTSCSSGATTPSLATGACPAVTPCPEKVTTRRVLHPIPQPGRLNPSQAPGSAATRTRAKAGTRVASAPWPASSVGLLLSFHCFRRGYG